jgi:hypothetical protein
MFESGRVLERLIRRAWRARRRVTLPRGFKSHPFRHFVKVLAVLDGEVAVPCNPQSAIAGLNPHLRHNAFGV